MVRYILTSAYIFICLGLMCNSFRVYAQRDSIPPMDKSVMDMSYCPPFYPIHKAQDRIIEPLVARAIYSRPAKNNRQLFGKLVEYDKIWRLGANEATEIEFFRDVLIQKTKLKKGRYTLFAIPGLDSCTLVLNKETDTWGAFLYEEKKDILRIRLPVETLATPMENFTLYFALNGINAKMVCMWDTYSFTLPFTVPKLK